MPRDSRPKKMAVQNRCCGGLSVPRRNVTTACIQRRKRPPDWCCSVVVDAGKVRQPTKATAIDDCWPSCCRLIQLRMSTLPECRPLRL